LFRVLGCSGNGWIASGCVECVSVRCLVVCGTGGRGWRFCCLLLGMGLGLSCRVRRVGLEVYMVVGGWVKFGGSCGGLLVKLGACWRVVWRGVRWLGVVGFVGVVVR